ncbi:MAG: cation diffusion facilitator family transporter [Melioribacteraceae bacterium]|nr:cation diffusion facilitator family transporter [Melioribacteraceae bacterium]
MSHNHSHTHTHEVKDFNKAFAFGVILNSIYILVEVFYGLIVNSMALIADAGHNLSDVLGLLLAWGAAHLAKKAASKTKTYGMRKSTILAALFNSVFLMIAVGAIAIEAIRKILEPEPVAGTTVMIVAGIGVFINTITALLFIRGRKSDLNIRGAFLHMAADAGVSAGVVLGGLIINFTSWYLIDPIISLGIVIVITYGTWGLLKESFNLSLDAVPKEIDFNEVDEYLRSIELVNDVHDLHIWGMSTTEAALTVHLIAPELKNHDQFIQKTSYYLKHHFGIDHSTFQIESDPDCVNCNLNK